ncbi:MAG: hypothetical protein B6I28_00690 [Fusobacteriia bacterium 4572_132]|nr:MAG: hypothetical protein B6I28_00690 [Fusobacteriia bacterium 4572_132]
MKLSSIELDKILIEFTERSAINLAKYLEGSKEKPHEIQVSFINLKLTKNVYYNVYILNLKGFSIAKY